MLIKEAKSETVVPVKMSLGTQEKQVVADCLKKIKETPYELQPYLTLVTSPLPTSSSSFLPNNNPNSNHRISQIALITQT